MNSSGSWLNPIKLLKLGFGSELDRRSFRRAIELIPPDSGRLIGGVRSGSMIGVYLFDGFSVRRIKGIRSLVQDITCSFRQAQTVQFSMIY